MCHANDATLLSASRSEPEASLKDQYFGDLNDYRKYGLLRAIVDATQLTLGVCWLRTVNDGRRDGECRSYLRNARWRRYDADLYDRLRRLLEPGVARTVLNAEAWELLPTAVYDHDLLTDSGSQREAYFDAAWRRLRASAIVFLDPDHGLEVPSVRGSSNGSARYLYWNEVCDGYARGHSLVIYQHFPRVPRDVFVPKIRQALRDTLPGPTVMTFRAGNAAYLVAIRPEHEARFTGVSDLVRRRWDTQIA